MNALFGKALACGAQFALSNCRCLRIRSSRKRTWFLGPSCYRMILQLGEPTPNFFAVALWVGDAPTFGRVLMVRHTPSLRMASCMFWLRTHLPWLTIGRTSSWITKVTRLEVPGFHCMV